MGQEQEGKPGRIRLIDLERKVTEKNDLLAAGIRARLHEAGVFSLNLLSGPGAGKTSLLEVSLAALSAEMRCLVIEGDLMTQNDAERIARLGVPAVQIQTRGTCHLDSRMIETALAGIDLASLDLLVIENVGNLVCPTGFDLGEDVKVVLASVTEGEDKPAKYPYIFERAGAVVLNKIDLLPHVPFQVQEFTRALRSLNPAAPLFSLSCTSREGVEPWLQWIRSQVNRGPTGGPPIPLS
jgi:hydrogenase nickel incorporation protein HypB